ncbi:hypothetical protein [Nocardiopsis quinghaiensis]|uniref:hypothetical protein n=1 Tax=Nocardiopsis quinghaiensis TaxID=464995 RepID=UPI001239ABC9|nr:hypothetical protein [Nocardiopsis quinghaiensis]
MGHGTEPRPCNQATLHDHVALDEIELYAEVLIAVADADHRLTPTEIDRVLGVSAPDGGAGSADAVPVPRTGAAGPTGPPPRVRDRSPVTRPPEPCEEEPEARVLPATGQLFPETRVLPEATPFTDMLPLPFDGPLTVWAPSGLPLAPWPS